MAALDVCVLDDPKLGTLSLDCATGYVVNVYDLGAPAVRADVSDRFNTDGTVDLTRHSGARTVQVQVTLDGNVRPFSRLRDRLAAYTQPDRRPTLTIREPGDTRVRRLQLRGNAAGIPVSSPKINKMTAAWVCPSGLIEGVEANTQRLTPTRLEEGRTYDRVYDRVYGVTGTTGGRHVITTDEGPHLVAEDGTHLVTEDSGGAGGGPAGSALLTNAGTKDAHWIARLHGALTNPVLNIGDQRLFFTANGGLVIAPGQTIVVESRGQQVYYDDGIGTPALQFLDFAASRWGTIAGGNGDDDGVTIASMTATEFDPAGSIDLTWYDTWT
jgi:hypothetical protein